MSNPTATTGQKTAGQACDVEPHWRQKMRKAILLAMVIVITASVAWSACNKREYAELKDMDENELIEAIRENKNTAYNLLNFQNSIEPEKSLRDSKTALWCIKISDDYYRQLKKRYKYNQNKIDKLNNKLEAESK